MRLKPVFADMGVSPARVNGVALSPIQEDTTEDDAAELDRLAEVQDVLQDKV